MIEIKGTIVRSESVMQMPLSRRFVSERATIFVFSEDSPSKKSKECEAMESMVGQRMPAVFFCVWRRTASPKRFTRRVIAISIKAAYIREFT